jgi:hypothetical protein
LHDRIAGIEAAFFWLSVRHHELTTAPSPADLEAMEFDGVLSQVARQLQSRAGDLALALEDRQIADGALIQLYSALNGVRPARRG